MPVERRYSAAEKEIILPIKPGQTEKLRLAYLLLSPKVYGYILNIINDPGEADQLAGDVFAKLTDEVAKKKGPKKNLNSYLYQIAKNCINDRFRSSQRIEDELEISEMETNFATSEHKNSVEEDLIVKDELEEIYVSAKKLPPNQQRALFLQINDYSLKESAALMGITEENVKILRIRAKAFIKKDLEKSNRL